MTGTTPPAVPDEPGPLVMPPDEFAVVSRVWRAWVDGPAREAFDRLIQEVADDAAGPWRDRAEAAEARLAAIRVSARDSGRVVATHPDDGTYAAKEISFAAGSSRSLAEIIAAFEHSNRLGTKEPGDGD